MTHTNYNKENIGLLVTNMTDDNNNNNINNMNSSNSSGSITKNRSVVSIIDTQQQQSNINNSSTMNNSDWVDTVVQCANIVNKIFTRNTCRLCHIYSDKQVEYEERIASSSISSSIPHYSMTTTNALTNTAAGWYNTNMQQHIQNSRYNHNNDYPDNNGITNEQSTVYDDQEHVPMSSTTTAISQALVVPVHQQQAVEMYRQYLFDEESVVDSIELRISNSYNNDNEEIGVGDCTNNTSTILQHPTNDNLQYPTPAQHHQHELLIEDDLNDVQLV